MSNQQIVFIDFSSIAHPVWHMAANDPNPNATSIGIIEKIRGLASGQPHCALCLDSRKSFRKALDATYKASRESKPEPFFHQCKIALETLKGDGFPTWEADGFEADDIVASGVEAAKVGSWPVLVVSADKDLLQLVAEHVSVKSPITGNVMTPAGVKEKFGVTPNQIQDYLAIVGDASDGVVGVKGIGAKGAAALLTAFGNLDDLYAALPESVGQLPAEGAAIKPAQMLALQAFRERLPIVRQLLALRTDAPIDFAAVLKERVPDDVATFGEDEIMSDINDAMPTHIEPELNLSLDKRNHRELTGAEAVSALGTFVADVARRVAPKDPAPKAEAIPPTVESARSGVGRAADTSAALVPVVVDYERQLEPQSMNQAVQLAGLLFKARLFGAYGTPEGILSTILAGRELGLQTMSSLRGFHIIENKPTMSADLIRALVLKSGKAKYFRCTERTPERATFETQRGDDPPISLTFTIEDARLAWKGTQDAWDKSGYGKNPADLLIARSSSKLSRLVYSDIVFNLYADVEFD